MRNAVWINLSIIGVAIIMALTIWVTNTHSNALNNAAILSLTGHITQSEAQREMAIAELAGTTIEVEAAETALAVSSTASAEQTDALEAIATAVKESASTTRHSPPSENSENLPVALRYPSHTPTPTPTSTAVQFAARLVSFNAQAPPTSTPTPTATSTPTPTATPTREPLYDDIRRAVILADETLRDFTGDGLTALQVEEKIDSDVWDWALTGNYDELPYAKIPLASQTNRGGISASDFTHLQQLIAANPSHPAILDGAEIVSLLSNLRGNDRLPIGDLSGTEQILTGEPSVSGYTMSFDTLNGTEYDVEFLTNTELDAVVNSRVADWAESGNTDTIPASKIPAQSGGSTTSDFKAVTSLPTAAGLDVGTLAYLENSGIYEVGDSTGSTSTLTTTWTPAKDGDVYGYRANSFGTIPSGFPAAVTEIFRDDDNRLWLKASSGTFNHQGIVVVTAAGTWHLHYDQYDTIDGIEQYFSGTSAAAPWTTSSLSITIHALGSATPFISASKHWRLVDPIPQPVDVWAVSGHDDKIPADKLEFESTDIQFAIDPDTKEWSATGFKAFDTLPAAADFPVGTLRYQTNSGIYEVGAATGKTGTLSVAAWTPSQSGNQNAIYGFDLEPATIRDDFGARPDGYPNDITAMYTGSDGRIWMIANAGVFSHQGIQIQVGDDDVWNLNFNATYNRSDTQGGGSYDRFFSGPSDAPPWTTASVAFTIHALGGVTPFTASVKHWTLVDPIPQPLPGWLNANTPDPHTEQGVTGITSLPSSFTVGQQYLLLDADDFQPWYTVTTTAARSGGGDNIVWVRDVGGTGWNIIYYVDGALAGRLEMSKGGQYNAPTSVTINGTSHSINPGSIPPIYVIDSPPTWTAGSTIEIWWQETGPTNYPAAVSYPPGDYIADRVDRLAVNPAGVSEWARSGNTDKIPNAKLPVGAITRLIDGPATGLSITNSGTNTRTAGAPIPFSPEFDLDDADKAAGVFEFEARVRIATRSANTIGFGTANAIETRLRGITFSQTLRDSVVYSASATNGVVIDEASVFNGATELGKITLYLTRSSANLAAWYLTYTGSAQTQNFTIGLTMEGGFLHNEDGGGAASALTWHQVIMPFRYPLTGNSQFATNGAALTATYPMEITATTPTFIAGTNFGTISNAGTGTDYFTLPAGNYAVDMEVTYTDDNTTGGKRSSPRIYVQRSSNGGVSWTSVNALNVSSYKKGATQGRGTIYFGGSSHVVSAKDERFRVRYERYNQAEDVATINESIEAKLLLTRFALE